MHRPSAPSQARSRESRARLLQAALECLVTRGYGATTVTAIHEKAGSSRGSLLYHFPAKDDLLVEAVKQLAMDRKEAIEAMAAAAQHSSPTEQWDRAIELLWAAFAEPQFTAAVELWVAARHKQDLAGTLTPNEREVGRATKDMLATAFGPDAAQHPDFDRFLTLLMSSMRGQILTYFFNPRDPATDPLLAEWKNMARRYLTPAPHRSVP